MELKKPLRLKPRDVRWPIRLSFREKSVVIPAVLDTGATTSLLSLGYARRLDMERYLRRTRSGRMLRSSARIRTWRGWIDRLEMLDLIDHERVRVTAGPLMIEVSPDLSERDGLLLGADVLTYLRCVLAFRPGQVDLRCDGRSGRLGAVMLTRLITIS
jgi:hypothetical protein